MKKLLAGSDIAYVQTVDDPDPSLDQGCMVFFEGARVTSGSPNYDWQFWYRQSQPWLIGRTWVKVGGVTTDFAPGQYESGTWTILIDLGPSPQGPEAWTVIQATGWTPQADGSYTLAPTYSTTYVGSYDAVCNQFGLTP